jgi:hypothetical protein
LEYIAAFFVPGLRRPWLISSFFHSAGCFETFISTGGAKSTARSTSTTSFFKF